MVIAPGRDGISAFVILVDGEYLPANLNSEKTVVMRRGVSTDNQLKIIKEFGKMADPSLLKPVEFANCEYQGEDGTPLHQHVDGSWWFYDATYTFERGPFETYEEADLALVVYCNEYQESLKNDLTTDQGFDKV